MGRNMKLKEKDYTDEHGPIWYGHQFGMPASRPVWKIINDGDDVAVSAVLNAMTSFGGAVHHRQVVGDSLVELLVRSAKDKRSDAWVGWRYIKAALNDMPDVSGDDLVWVNLIDARVEHILEGGAK